MQVGLFSYRLYSLSSDQTIRIWNIENFEELKKNRIEIAKNCSKYFAINNKETMIYYDNGGGKLNFYNLETCLLEKGINYCNDYEVTM